MNNQEYSGKRKLKYILFSLAILLLIIIILLIRDFSIKQIDDVTPGRFCERNLVEKSQTLMIIPLLDNISIADNVSWCDYILSLNKTLGMHGVYHTPNEFSYKLGEGDIRKGMEEFKKCFGFYPPIFEAPRLDLNRENEKILREMGFEVRGYRFSIFHKVYHCVDFNKNSYLVKQNKIIEIF